jgi:hypothetical protein
MNLKTTEKVAIELASIGQDGTTELLGIEPLCEVSFPFKCAVNNKVFTKDNTFIKVFGLDCYFFYSLEQVRKEEIVRYERGIGKLEKVDKRLYLKREIPIAHALANESPQPCTNGCSYFDCSDCDHIVARSSFPITYAECLHSINSLITCNRPFLPSSLIIDENSVVARLKGHLQSLSFEELLNCASFKEELFSLIKKYNKQLSLSSPKLNVKKIQTSCLQLDPSDDNAIKKNSIIYNDNCLKFYDGSNWHKITMEPIE